MKTVKPRFTIIKPLHPIHSKLSPALIAFFGLLLWASDANAQLQGQAYIDSLLQVLDTAPDDTNKVKLYDEISYTYYGIDPDKGIEYGKQGLALAEKLNWKKGIAIVANVIGINYSFGKTDNVRGLEYYLKALKASEEMGDNKRIAAITNNIASIYDDEKEYEKALEYYQKALDINIKTGNRQSEANNLGNIGALYSSLRMQKEALDYKTRSLKLNEELGDSIEIATSLLRLVLPYGELEQYENVRSSLERAQGIFNNYQRPDGIATCMGQYGSLYQNITTDTSEAARSFLQQHFGGNKLKALQLSKDLLDSSIVLNKQIGQLDQLVNNYKGLSITQELLGDYAGALENQRLYFAYNDTLFNMEKDKNLTELALNYEFEKKEAAAKAEQEKKDAVEKNIRNSITAGLIAALIFLVVVVIQRNKIAKARKRSDELLLNILPATVADELKSKGEAEAKQIDEVTVLFTDFKGFTELSEKLTPKELVRDLHECFTAFDNIMQKNGLEKIKTIGDAYMAAGGLPTPNTTHAGDVVKAALEIRNFMEEGKAKKLAASQPYFEIRIGVHSGPVVAGIVGVKKFSYDIWGDTVNTASRMESSGEVGKVNISGTTYAMVKEQFNCTPRGKITAKGKGEVEMYFVEG